MTNIHDSSDDQDEMLDIPADDPEFDELDAEAASEFADPPGDPFEPQAPTPQPSAPAPAAATAGAATAPAKAATAPAEQPKALPAVPSEPAEGPGLATGGGDPAEDPEEEVPEDEVDEYLREMLREKKEEAKKDTVLASWNPFTRSKEWNVALIGTAIAVVLIIGWIGLKAMGTPKRPTQPMRKADLASLAPGAAGAPKGAAAEDVRSAPGQSGLYVPRAKAGADGLTPVQGGAAAPVTEQVPLDSDGVPLPQADPREGRPAGAAPAASTPPPAPHAPDSWVASLSMKLPQAAEPQAARAEKEKATETRAPNTPLGLGLTLAEGTKIPAVMVSAISTPFEGPVELLIEADFRVGDEVVFPAGTKVIGRSSADAAEGRIYVTLHKIVLPDNRSLRVQAIALNDDMTAGLVADEIDRHTAQHYRNGAIAATIGTVDGAINRGRGRGLLRQLGRSSSEQMLGRAERSFESAANTKPTLKVHAGHTVIVYFDRDTLV